MNNEEHRSWYTMNAVHMNPINLVSIDMFHYVALLYRGTIIYTREQYLSRAHNGICY
jgi:hypothetical protein